MASKVSFHQTAWCTTCGPIWDGVRDVGVGDRVDLGVNRHLKANPNHYVHQSLHRTDYCSVLHPVPQGEADVRPE